MDSTERGEASVSVPFGDTTAIDPKRSGNGSPKGTLDSEGPPSVLAIQTMPDIDTDACGRNITYPKEALALGIEGDVKLRVALDASGQVTSVKILAGLGHGLDHEAVAAIKHRCKFTPAIATDGRPVPFIIESYVFHFEIPR